MGGFHGRGLADVWCICRGSGWGRAWSGVIPGMDVLSLGDAQAVQLGFRPRGSGGGAGGGKLHGRGGGLGERGGGFVGLAVPHLARLAFGSSNPGLLAWSGCWGDPGGLVGHCGQDGSARGAELPVGGSRRFWAVRSSFFCCAKGRGMIECTGLRAAMGAGRCFRASTCGSAKGRWSVRGQTAAARPRCCTCYPGGAARAGTVRVAAGMREPCGPGRRPAGSGGAAAGRAGGRDDGSGVGPSGRYPYLRCAGVWGGGRAAADAALSDTGMTDHGGGRARRFPGAIPDRAAGPGLVPGHGDSPSGRGRREPGRGPQGGMHELLRGKNAPGLTGLGGARSQSGGAVLRRLIFLKNGRVAADGPTAAVFNPGNRGRGV